MSASAATARQVLPESWSLPESNDSSARLAWQKRQEQLEWQRQAREEAAVAAEVRAAAASSAAAWSAGDNGATAAAGAAADGGKRRGCWGLGVL